MIEAFIFIIGLFVGSFLNVLASRLPRGESVLWDRSHCDFCKKTLRWFELIPLFSYIVQGGRCRRCHKKLSIQYPLMELVTGVSFVILFVVFSSVSLPILLSYYFLYCSLLVIFISDLETQIIPDSMIVMGLVAVMALRWLEFSSWALLIPYVISSIGAYVFFYCLWRGTKGRGMGFGDVKFAFLMGLFLGYPGIIIAMYIAFLTGAIVGVILMIRGKSGLKSKIAFGPFLILGTVAVWFFATEFVKIWRMFL